MTKFASLKKIHTKIIIVKRNLELNDLGFFYIQQKHALTCPGLHRLIFQSLYHTSLILPKRKIDEIINFRNFRKLFINNLPWFFGILVPHLEKGKTKQSDQWQGTWSVVQCMTVTCTLHWVSWCSFKKIVIIKMNKML